MSERPNSEFRPGLEPLEAKRLLNGGGSTAPIAGLKAGSRALASQPAGTPGALSTQAVSSNPGYRLYRITNPDRFNNHIALPVTPVLVQSIPPVPGQVYNLLYVAVRNGTAQTFDASSGFQVSFAGNPQSFPILTGNEQWKPGQEFVFYILSKKIYPVPNVVSTGFEFQLGGARSEVIPGPSGSFLRLKYNPAKFDRQLNWIVTSSSAVPGGVNGIRYGLPDTAIYEFVSANTERNDFSLSGGPVVSGG